MHDFQSFHTAFKTYLADNWVETPIVESVNIAGGFDGYTPFVTYKTDYNATSTNTISGMGGGGRRSKFRDILMVITIYVPSESGETTIIDLCQKMEDLFDNVQIVPGSFARDSATNDIEKSEGLWFGREVAVYFENREFSIA